MQRVHALVPLSGIADRPIARLGWCRLRATGCAMLCGLLIACTSVDVPPTPTMLGAAPPTPSIAAAATPGQTAVATSPTLDPAVPTVTVRRGTIAPVITLTGRVIGRDELPITATGSTQARRILVAPGNTVSEGQPLIETGAADGRRRIEDARSREQTAARRAEQAQARIQEQLQQATEAADRLQRSTLSADLQLAQSTALQARAGVQRAEADLAALIAPPSVGEVRAADQQIRAAEVVLQRAEADRDRVLDGPSDADVRKAEHDVTAAENALRQAVNAAQNVEGGPDPAKVRSAQRAVQLAQTSLQVAQRPPPEIAAAHALVLAARNRSSRERQATQTLARQQIEAALARQQLDTERAEAELADAIHTLQAASQRPDTQDVEIASRDVAIALETLTTAREQLAVLQAGPTQLEIDEANTIVDGARIGLEQAQARRAALDAGPPASQQAAAQAAVTSARAARAAAEDRVTDLTTQQRGEVQQLSEAQARIGLFQGILTGAVYSLDEAAKPDADADVVEFARAQTELAEARGDLAALPEDPGPPMLVAPAAGTIATIRTGPGEEIRPDQPALTMVRAADLVVQASLETPDGSRIAQGMSARVRLSTAPGTDLPATVDRIDESPGGRTAQVSVTWSPPLPAVGTAAQALVALPRHEDALLVPTSTIRADGDRRFVDLVTGTTIQRVEVTTGLTNGTDAEILGGVQEGQRVLLGQRP